MTGLLEENLASRPSGPITLELGLNRPQSLAHRVIRPRTSTCLAFGRGVGKSYFLRLLWYLAVAEFDGKLRTTALKPFRGVRIIHTQSTFKSFKDVHASSIERELAPDGDFGFLRAKIDHTSWRISFPGGSWIQPFGSREATAKAARGMRADIGTNDECDDTDPGVADAVHGPWFSENWSFQTRIFGGTPRRGRYGLLYREHKAGLEGALARRTDLSKVADPDERERLLALRTKFTFHATYRDSPETVDQRYVAQQRILLPLPVFKREWECDFDSAEGLVYPHFSDEIHVRSPRKGAEPSLVLVGVDHGWEDPAVFLVILIFGKGRDAVAHVVREIYEPHQLDVDFWIPRAKEIKKRYPKAYWYGDPSRPDRIEALRRGAGVNFVDDVNNAIEDGVSSVANKLAVRVHPEDRDADEPRMVSQLYVDPSCKKTIWEFQNYRRKRDKHNEDRFLDDIEDKHNHCLVAGTMVATADGDVPIESVEPGTLVRTRKGLRRVTASGMTRRDAETFVLEMSDGTTLEGTSDHPIWTRERGWVFLNELRYADTLVSWPGSRIGTSESTPSESSSTAFRTAEREPVRVAAVRASGRRADVFDLTVEDAHEFFANGVLVHNCMDALRYPLFTYFGAPTPPPRDI